MNWSKNFRLCTGFCWALPLSGCLSRVKLKQCCSRNDECCTKYNTAQWITWLEGRWRTQLTARRNVNCRTHEHRHFERTLRTEDYFLCPCLAQGRLNIHPAFHCAGIGLSRRETRGALRLCFDGDCLQLILLFQDGATCHTTERVLAWLKTKFQTRIISRNADKRNRGGVNWPSRSPDLNPLDFWYLLILPFSFSRE